MRRPKDIIVIDGKPWLWRDILALRQAQLAERRALKQLDLFPARQDSRQPSQRTASRRYAEPTLFDREE